MRKLMESLISDLEEELSDAKHLRGDDEYYAGIAEKLSCLLLYIKELVSKLANDDLVSKSALKNAICKSTCHWAERMWKQVACDIIDNQPAVFGSEWIPCAKELPNVSNSYLVTKMCKNDGNPIYETAHEIFWTRDGKWDCERDEDCEWIVTAWREKLEPYRPEMLEDNRGEEK